MEKTELLACPHCGNSAIVVEICGGHFYKVKCRNIMACGAETERFDDEEEAASAWNRRTTPADNKSLTLTELREMDGEPVWVKSGGRVFACIVQKRQTPNTDFFAHGFHDYGGIRLVHDVTFTFMASDMECYRHRLEKEE